MLEASDRKLPVLEPLVEDLINAFGIQSDFPVVLDTGVDKKEFIKNKQNVGRMVKLIMAQYGYKPIRTNVKINVSTKAHSFKTCSVYEAE